MPSRKGTRYKDAQERKARTGPASKQWPQTRRFASTLTNILAILALFILVYALQHFTGWFTDHRTPTQVKTDQTITESIQEAVKETKKKDEVEVLPPSPSPRVEKQPIKETISEAEVAAIEQPIEKKKPPRYQPRRRRISRRAVEARLVAKHRATVDDLDNEEARLRYQENNRILASGGTTPEEQDTWSTAKTHRTSRHDLDVGLVKDLDNEEARRRYQEQNRILASGGTIPEGYSPRSAAYTTADDFIPFER